MKFKLAKWIWCKNSKSVDDYAQFSFSFKSKEKNLRLRISCDTVYAVYQNHKLLRFMHCADYPHYKYFDEIKIKNNEPYNFLIDVWHYGKSSHVYANADHGVIFEIINTKNKVIYYSNKNTLSRVMNEFKNGYQKEITVQNGFSFLYDNTVKKNSFSSSILLKQNIKEFEPRNIKEFKLEKRESIDIIRKKDSYLIDLKKERAGIIDFDIDSSKKQKVLISFGEHIKDGQVRRIVNKTRDFSFELVLKKGNNKIINPLKRIAGRYLQIYSKDPIKIKYAGLREVNYPLIIIKKEIKDPLLKKIYDTCLDTLRLCMHEHYEDCPWREQALYCMDSRNQMLCGYYAFKGYEYQKHNLLLIAQSYLKNGLLSITFPTDIDLAIPSFSLVYFLQVYEYVKYTKDKSILSSVKPTLDALLKTFKNRLDKNNLIKPFKKPFWNFYEWSKDSDNGYNLMYNKYPHQYDLILNELYVIAINCYNELFNTNYSTKTVLKAIKTTFYNKSKGLFKISTIHNTYTQLGNSLAVLIGLGNETLIKKLVNDKSLVSVSLSMRCFFYDALLSSKNSYKKYIINDIKQRYKKMLDDGATSFYETEEGDKAFDNAGSLCHGWSAMPVYYINKLVK